MTYAFFAVLIEEIWHVVPIGIWHTHWISPMGQAMASAEILMLGPY